MPNQSTPDRPVTDRRRYRRYTRAVHQAGQLRPVTAALSYARSRLDPILYHATRGRLTLTGPSQPTMLLTTRKPHHRSTPHRPGLLPTRRGQPHRRLRQPRPGHTRQLARQPTHRPARHHPNRNHHRQLPRPTRNPSRNRTRHPPPTTNQHPPRIHLRTPPTAHPNDQQQPASNGYPPKTRNIGTIDRSGWRRSSA